MKRKGSEIVRGTNREQLVTLDMGSEGEACITPRVQV